MNGIGSKFTLADRFLFDSVSNSLIDKNFDDEFIRLGSNESRILLLFSLRPHEVITRDELYDFVWREQGFEVDDSSLTQAISTLRKQLKDSTKSPQFIKTVPKRGYQFIATVSNSVEEQPTDEYDSVNDADLADISATFVEPTPAASEETVSTIPVQESEEPITSVPAKTGEKRRSVDMVSKILFLVAVLLPIFTVLFTNPNQSEFRQMANFDGVLVNTPLNHPDLTEWLPSIEMCVNSYRKFYQGEFALEEVIATGGQNDVLVLNYIHKPTFSSANVTLKIVANQEEINKVCQRGPSS